MGLGGISIWQLLIVLVIVVLLFGTKKLRNMGGDLGTAIRNFKGAMNDGEKEQTENNQQKDQAKLAEKEDSSVIEGQVKQADKS